ncbi:MAG: 16S rRNA (cytosine(967)-C(5))-methyltransferase [Gammaproteobacteria bacterium]|nr:MAG: 16S rRNA (cytosine(967)-C(5))-methyltransferase [Gammaproteobacteria bacterium]
MNILPIVRVVSNVLYKNQHLKQALQFEFKTLDQKDQASVQAMTYEIIRYYLYYEILLNKLLKKPLIKKNFDIKNILIIALVRLDSQQQPEYAVVNESVQSIKKIKKNWASGFVNGVLREFIRNPPNEKQDRNILSYPQWLIKIFKNDWGDDYLKIIKNSNLQPPLTARVNNNKITTDEYLKKIKNQALPHSFSPSAIIFDKACSVEDIYGFNDGLISIQDVAAQLCLEFLDLNQGQKVLDSCAAPGGKTCHILESYPQINLIANDIKKIGIAKIKDNLKRLDLKCNLTNYDVLQLKNEFEKNEFDRILFDAPCSATGIIRRHPDIKLHRTAEDIENLMAIQQQMLKILWQFLKPDGKLLYVTCSILKQENDQQIEAFLNNNKDAEHLQLKLTGINNEVKYGLQVLPNNQQMDGFYYALLQKK